MSTTVAAPAAPTLPTGMQVRPRRNPQLIAAGILLIVVGALVTAWAWSASHTSREVIIMAQPVSRGEQISSDHLGVVALNGADGASVVSVGDADTLIGQYAQTDLPKGVVVHADAVTPEALAGGRARVGIKLSAGRLPASLASGTHVELVEVTADGHAGSTFAATIMNAPQPGLAEFEYLIDCEVSAAHAAEVAALAATDQIAVVQVGG